MTRERYSIVLPIAITLFVASGFAVGTVFPNLPSLFYLVYLLVGGVVIITFDRLARRKVIEPLIDERIQGIAESSAWISHRVSLVALGLGGFLLIYAFPSIEGLRFIGIGAVCSVALQSLIFGIVFKLIQIRK